MRSFFLILIIAFSLNGHATIIELSFDQTSYTENEIITGKIVASSLTSTLGGFAGAIQFDPSKLTLISLNFSNGFDDGLGSYSFADDSTSGILYLEDYADAFANETIIIANQGANFVLASFTFNSISSGVQTVNLLSRLEVVSFDNSGLEAFAQQSVSFNTTKVPEPMTSLLFGSCLLLIRKKRI